MDSPSAPLPSLADISAYLSQFLEDADTANSFFVPILSCVLSQITARNDELSLSAQQVTIFHALKTPAISIRAYLDRLVKYAHCSPECFVVALIYLDRLIHRNPGFIISTLNVHRLLVTSVMTAAKFFDDVYYNNGYYARVGGVSNKEMNALELEFLYLINFNLSISTADFARYQQELCAHSASVHETSCHCCTEHVVCQIGAHIQATQGVCVDTHQTLGDGIERGGSADSINSVASVACDDVIYHNGQLAAEEVISPALAMTLPSFEGPFTPQPQKAFEAAAAYGFPAAASSQGPTTEATRHYEMMTVE